MKLINDISLKVILNFSSLIDRYAPKRFCDVFSEAVGRLVQQRHTKLKSERKKPNAYVKLDLQCEMYRRQRKYRHRETGWGPSLVQKSEAQ